MGETATLIGSGSGGGGGYLAALAHSPPVLSPALSPHASRHPSFCAQIFCNSLYFNYGTRASLSWPSIGILWVFLVNCVFC